jgi:hypothetical protein
MAVVFYILFRSIRRITLFFVFVRTRGLEPVEQTDPGVLVNTRCFELRHTRTAFSRKTAPRSPHHSALYQ